MLKTVKNNENGFTLIETMASIAIGMFVLAIAFSMFYVQRKAFTLQEQIVEMNQNARAALNMISVDVRMAGYNAGGTMSVSEAGTITFSIDTDSITYTLDDKNNEIDRKENTGSKHAIAENIETLDFTYTNNSSGNTDTVTITIVARTDNFDEAYVGDGYRRATVTTTVKLRN